MRHPVIFFGTWASGGVAVYAYMSTLDVIRPGQELDYQVGSGVVGLIAAILAALAVR